MILILNLALAQGRVAVLDVRMPSDILWGGERIVVVDGRGEATVLNATSLQIERTVEVPRWVDGVQLSAEGSHLLVPGGTVRVVDLDTGEVIFKEKSGRWGGATYGLSPDGLTLVRGEEILETFSLEKPSKRTEVRSDCCWSSVGFSGDQPWGLAYGLVETPGQSWVVSESVWEVQVLDGALALHGAGQTQIVDLQTGALSWEAPPGTGTMMMTSSFSPDGELIAWAGQQGGVEVWNRRLGLPGVSIGGGMGVSALAWSPDSHHLALLRNDGLVEVHAVEGEPRLKGRPLTVGFVEDLAVAVFASGWVVVWEEGESGWTEARRLLLPLEPGWEADRTVALAPGAKLVAVTTHGTVETWDLRTGSPQGRPLPGSRGDTDVAVGSDGSLALRSGSWVFTFDAQRRLIARMPGSSSRIAVGRGGTRLAVRSNQGLVVYDVLTGRSLGSITEQGLGNAMAFEGEELLFVQDGSLMRWTLDSPPEAVYVGEDSVEDSSISGGRLLSRTWSGDFECDEVTVSLPPLTGARDIGLHPTRMLAIRADETGRVELVDLVSGERELLLGGSPGMGAVSALDGRWAAVMNGEVHLDDGTVLSASSPVTAVALTAAGVRAGTRDGTLVLWSEGVAHEVSVGEVGVRSLLSRGGTLLAIDDYGVVSSWDPASLEPRPLPYAYASGIAVGPDGVPYYAQGWDGVYRLDDEWTPLKIRRRLRRGLQGSLAVCADGTVVAAREDWRRPDVFLAGQTRLKPVHGGVTGVQLVACDERLAMGTWNGMVAVVDPRTGERGTVLTGDGTAVTGLVWLDADTLLVAWSSGEVAEVSID